MPVPGVPELTTPSVVVAHDLAPSETATLDRAMVLAIVTEAGVARAPYPESLAAACRS